MTNKKLNQITAGQSLCMAAYRAETRYVASFLDRGIELTTRIGKGSETTGGAALRNALSTPYGDEIAILLANHGADPNERNERGVSPLMIASGRGGMAVVRAFLEHGGDPAAADASGQNAIHYARAGLHSEVVELLISFWRQKFPDEPTEALLRKSPLEARLGLPPRSLVGACLALELPIRILAISPTESECLEQLWREVGQPRYRSGPYLLCEILNDVATGPTPLPLSTAQGADEKLEVGHLALLLELPPYALQSESTDQRGYPRVTIAAVAPLNLSDDYELLIANGRRLRVRVAAIWSQEDGYQEQLNAAIAKVGAFV